MSLMDDVSEKSLSLSGLGMLEEWHPLLIGSEPNPSITFTTFRGGKENAWLLDVIRGLSAGKKTVESGILFIHGGPGLGKTHLLSAAAEAANRRAQMIHVADLEAELSRAKRLDALAECYRWLFANEILLFDGVDHTTDNEVFEADFIHILDRMVRGGKTVVLSSGVVPSRLAVSNPRLSSLLSSGLLMEIKICGESDRRQILRDTTEFAGLSDEIVTYLAHNVQDSIRRLKAAARQIAAIGEQTGMPADLAMARAVVPLPEDLCHAIAAPDEAQVKKGAEAFFVSDRASFFRDMLGEAETEEEQALALQIAISQRLREMRCASDSAAAVLQLEEGLALLREGHLQEAMQRINRK